jgi:hypothetical protein
VDYDEICYYLTLYKILSCLDRWTCVVGGSPHSGVDYLLVRLDKDVRWG